MLVHILQLKRTYYHRAEVKHLTFHHVRPLVWSPAQGEPLANSSYPPQFWGYLCDSTTLFSATMSLFLRITRCKPSVFACANFSEALQNPGSLNSNLNILLYWIRWIFSDFLVTPKYPHITQIKTLRKCFKKLYFDLVTKMGEPSG